MAASASYSVPSMVRGYHEYMNVWDAAVGEILPCSNEDGNLHDPYAVSVKKGASLSATCLRKFRAFVRCF